MSSPIRPHISLVVSLFDLVSAMSELTSQKPHCPGKGKQSEVKLHGSDGHCQEDLKCSSCGAESDRSLETNMGGALCTPCFKEFEQSQLEVGEISSLDEDYYSRFYQDEKWRQMFGKVIYAGATCH